jgi:hypothetical protein
MDQAVALVETYLRINSFVTVTAFPAVEATECIWLLPRPELPHSAQRVPEMRHTLPERSRKTKRKTQCLQGFNQPSHLALHVPLVRAVV